jgi:hypothetical protein
LKYESFLFTGSESDTDRSAVVTEVNYRYLRFISAMFSPTIRSHNSDGDPETKIILDDSPVEEKIIVLEEDYNMSKSRYQVTSGTGMFSDCLSFAYVDPNKNQHLDVYKLTYGSGQNVHFKCLVCSLEYVKTPNNLKPLERKHPGKPYCGHCNGTILCDNHRCYICFSRRYASHEYSVNCLKDPYKYKIRYTYALPHKCPVCYHKFDMPPNDITDPDRERRCPFCVSKRKCDSSLGCKVCIAKSAASNIFASQIDDPNPDHRLELLCKNDTTKNIRWSCYFCGGHFFATCNARSRNPFGGCGSCRNKTEQIVNTYFESIFPGDVKQGVKYNWCRSTRSGLCLPFDLVIEKYKLIVEIDGEQHFRDVKAWRVNKYKQHDNDVFKMRLAYENGYSVTRIQQTDIFYNTIPWRELLKEAIHSYDNPSLILIGNETSLLKKAYVGYTYGQAEHRLPDE